MINGGGCPAYGMLRFLLILAMLIPSMVFDNGKLDVLFPLHSPSSDIIQP